MMQTICGELGSLCAVLEPIDVMPPACRVLWSQFLGVCYPKLVDIIPLG